MKCSRLDAINMGIHFKDLENELINPVKYLQSSGHFGHVTVLDVYCEIFKHM